ncbi:MAG TPA: DUF4118 domain-containing protein [Blastocatellia bacterium]|nr:DUF4118 domain-containing protein [Blastocatellia bacterium]
MSSTYFRLLRTFGLAVASSSAALVLTLELQPVLRLGYSVLFLAAVMVSARFGGLWPGLLATVLAFLSLSYFFLPPANSFVVREMSGIFWLVTFVLVAFLISSLNEGRIRAEAKLTIANQSLESRVGERTTQLMRINEELEREITNREQVAIEKERLITELQNALGEVTTLKGLLPICTSCKRIRDTSNGTWNELETYISRRSEATFSHTMCPECARRVYPKYPFMGG